MAIAVITESFDSALDTFEVEPARKLEQQARALRADILERFPIEDWPTLSLDRYADGFGTDENRFCWTMEFGSELLGGIGGGSAHKHLIFWSQDKQGWVFPDRYETVEEAWDTVRAGFVRAFDLAAERRFDEIDDIPAIKGGRTLLLKSLYLYFPDDFVYIFGQGHLRHYLAQLGVDTRRIGLPAARVAANRTLLEILRSDGRLQHLSDYCRVQFLYHWAHPTLGIRAFKMGPGPNGEQWPTCRDGGFICLGWPEIGDLTAFTDFREFQKAFGETYPDERGRANELWKLRLLESGDKIIAARGDSEVLAVGTVDDEGYRFRPEIEAAPHTLSVDWDTSAAATIEPQDTWRRKIVASVSGPLYRQIVRSADDASVVEIDPVHLDIEEALARRGQVILYGPPGTGKTYTARRVAVWLLRGGSRTARAADVLDDPALFATEEQALSSPNGDRPPLLSRVTFHPSFTYEDFVEGYRPQPGTEPGLRLELIDGIFKTVCNHAAADPDNHHIILIDEINRGNVPKILGELITLIEKDKRGLTVHLPQSGTELAVPPNVSIIATMNTADRSIHLLDSALRRRFGFIELLPDSTILTGATIGPLALDRFLDNLNGAIRLRFGREKQIGHALFFEDGAIVESPETFSAIFRHEILPLLQEYLYEDYRELAELLGDDIIDRDEERLSSTVVDDPELLCDALAAHFDASIDP